MLERTKKPPTDSLKLVGTPEVINRVRKYAIELGAGIVDSPETVPASEISPQLESNPGGVYLRGIRLREEMTQEGLAQLTGIPRGNISAMEHGRRSIGKDTARKLAAVLKCDYRRFL